MTESASSGEGLRGSEGVGPRDRFGNPVDPVVGYARGRILRHSLDETVRDARGNALLEARLRRHGADSVFVFTGAPCDFPLAASDLDAGARESVGPALFGAALRRAGADHLGGDAETGVAVLNRTSGGIVAAALALSPPGEPLVSLVPGHSSHPCVSRGARLAGSPLVEVSTLEALATALEGPGHGLVVLTGVTSELSMIPEPMLAEALRMIREAGRVSLVDDAYGARVRTVLAGQSPALVLGADLVITSCQKAGLPGPRAGLLAGDPGLVRRVLSRATELGQEGRGPMALAVLRGLEGYRPEHVRGMADAGQAMERALAESLGARHVASTPLGPLVEADDLLELALERSPRPGDPPAVVPAEAGAALGMFLLERHGYVTVNALGAPGARVSLRLKCSAEELERAGGEEAVAAAVEEGLCEVGERVHDAGAIRGAILG